MAFNLDNMATVLRAAGLKVVETPGWKTRGYAQQDLKACLGVLWHHTATNRLQFAGNNIPTLNMLINGRSDLPGPLCNLGFGRDGTVYIVATGVANHAGAGYLPGIPRDMGNHYLIGIEMESSGIKPWDWTPEQLYWAPRLGAALEKGFLMGLPPEKRIQAAHYEYSSQGKIDPAGWPGNMDGLRASINAILAGPAPKPPAPKPPVKDAFEMATPDDFFNKSFARQGPGATGTTSLGGMVAWMDSNLRNIMNQNAAQDAVIKSLVGAVAALSKGQTFDEAKLLDSIQARVEAGIQNVDELAAAGVQEAIDSIDTTVNVNLKPKE